MPPPSAEACEYESVQPRFPCLPSVRMNLLGRTVVWAVEGGETFSWLLVTGEIRSPLGSRGTPECSDEARAEECGDPVNACTCRFDEEPISGWFSLFVTG